SGAAAGGRFDGQNDVVTRGGHVVRGLLGGTVTTADADAKVLCLLEAAEVADFGHDRVLWLSTLGNVRCRAGTIERCLQEQLSVHLHFVAGAGLVRISRDIGNRGGGQVLAAVGAGEVEHDPFLVLVHRLRFGVVGRLHLITNQRGSVLLGRCCRIVTVGRCVAGCLPTVGRRRVRGRLRRGACRGLACSGGTTFLRGRFRRGATRADA